jgi:hypothetical protein
LVLPKGSDGHGLIMQFAPMAMRERRNFPIGVESGNRRLSAQHFANSFDFLFDALFENQLSADATDENGKIRCGAARTRGSDTSLVDTSPPQHVAR